MSSDNKDGVKRLLVDGHLKTGAHGKRQIVKFEFPVEAVLASDYDRDMVAKEAEASHALTISNKLVDHMKEALAAKDAELQAAHEALGNKAKEWAHSFETIATLQRELEAAKAVSAKARQLYVLAIRLVDKYSREKQPDAKHYSVDECMARYDAEIEAAKGAK